MGLEWIYFWISKFSLKYIKGVGTAYLDSLIR